MKLNINRLFLILFAVFIAFSWSSCVSKKQFDSMQVEYDANLAAKNNALEVCQSALATSEQKNNQLSGQVTILESNAKVREEQLTNFRAQVDDLKKQRDEQRAQLNDLTNLSKSTSSNINQSLEQLSRKDAYIQSLQRAKSRIDSFNFVLTNQLTAALTDVARSGDASIKLEKTQIKINLSDRLLYQVGSTALTDRGVAALDTIAGVLQNYPDWSVLVEGHSDNIKPTGTCTTDNWDVSARRAAAVTRALAQEGGLNPKRITSGARSEFDPIDINGTPEGRAKNRRISLILQHPQQQLYDLLRADRVPK